jgi:outer membrane protein assembly factor BamB
MRRLFWFAILSAIGCGRGGIPLTGTGATYTCGAGTYAAGQRCLPIDDAGTQMGAGDAGAGATDAGSGDAGSSGADAATPTDDGGTVLDLGGPPRRDPPPGSAVTYQIDRAHSGGQPTSMLRPPLTQRWSVTLSSTYLSYPIIVDGGVYVTGSGTNGEMLYGLSATTGDPLWQPIVLSHKSNPEMVSAAWDDGKLFAINSLGVLQVFDATTAALLWSRALGGNSSVGAPVVADGLVFVEAGYETLFALDEHTGAVKWHGSPGGSPTSPAWTPDAIVLQYVDGTISAFTPSTGASLWKNNGGYTGGGGAVPVIYQGRAYALYGDVLVPNSVYQVSDGQLLGTFSASTAPAFENGLGFFRTNSTLEARDMSGASLWSFTGDGMLDSTPIAAGGVVYVGSASGTLYALDELSGGELWSDTMSAAVAPSNDNDTTSFMNIPTTGLAASLDLLVVPAGSTLTAYGN